MKLHLPLGLRFALALSLAAFAAAPSTAAVTQLEIPGSETSPDYVSVGTSDAGVTNSVYIALPTAQTWDDNWSVVVSAQGSTLTGNLTLMGLYMQLTGEGNENFHGVSEGATMSGGNLTLTTWTTATIQKTNVDFTSYDNVTFVMSRDDESNGLLSLRAYDSSNFAAGPLFTLQQADQSFDDYNLEGFVLGALGSHTKYESTSNHVNFADDGNVGDYSVTKVGFSSGSVASALDLANYFYSDSKSLTWNGGQSGDWTGAAWVDAEGQNQSFSAHDSVTFATDGAQVALTEATAANSIVIQENTGISLGGNPLSAAELTVADGKTLTLAGEGGVTIADMSGGAVSIDGSSLTVSVSVSDMALTVENGGSVTAKSITGSTVSLSQNSTFTLTGTVLENTSVTCVSGASNATVILAGNDNIDLKGNVTLGPVVNNMSGNDAYAFIGYDDVTLKFTGAADLTMGGTSTHSHIGLNRGKIIVAEGASLTTGRIYNSTTAGNNAHVEVAEGGTLEITGSSVSTLASLTNSGSVTVASGNIRRNFRVYGKVDNKAGASITAGTLQITNAGNLTSVLGGTVDVTKLQLDGGKATVSGAVTAGQIVGMNASNIAVLDVVDGGSLTLAGTTLSHTTVSGTLTLKGASRIGLTGAVTLENVVNNMTGTDDYAFTGTGESIRLKFTGTADLTHDGQGAATTHSKIGVRYGTIEVAEDSSLTTARIWNSNATVDNARVIVANRGTLAMTGAQLNIFVSLENGGSITAGSENARSDIKIRGMVDNQTGSKLTAGTLQLENVDGVALTLDGTVDVTSLQLDAGSAVLSGNVTAGKVTDSANNRTGAYSGTDEGSGTLTIMGNAGDGSTGSTLSGNFSIVKQGESTQNFTGSDNSGFVGSLHAEGGVLNLASMDAAMRSLQEIRVANSATLGLYSAAVGGTVATVSANRLETGVGGGTLNANVVMGADTDLVLDSTLALGGALTLDGTLLSGALLGSLNSGATDSITLFTGVASLTIGNGSAILPGSFTEMNDVGVLSYQFSADELGDAFRNGFDADVYSVYYTAANGGSIIMTANVPEPATATLSLLALAALCARRRRK